MIFLVYQKHRFRVLKFTGALSKRDSTYLHLHTARAPWASQSAFCPQGSCEQGLSLHLTKGSPKINFNFWNFLLSYIEIIYMIFLHTCKASGTFANSSSTSIFTFGIYTTRILITRIDLAVWIWVPIRPSSTGTYLKCVRFRNNMS